MTATNREIVRSEDGTSIGYETVGVGDGLLVLGGAWRTSRDYLPFAHALAESFAVHVIDRRGRGRSGPQGAAYAIERELEDLAAVQARTRASLIFGHSYGGLIALEAARRNAGFTDVVLYEPGVSIAGSIPLGWMPRYRELLARGEGRGAFAAMIRSAGGAPAALEHAPLWYVKLMLRLFIRDPDWQKIEALLETALPEHEQVGALDEPTAERYRDVTARVVLLGGANSPPRFTTVLFDHLSATIPNVTSELVPGIGHTAPDHDAPDIVAERVRHHLQARSKASRSADRHTATNEPTASDRTPTQLRR